MVQEGVRGAAGPPAPAAEPLGASSSPVREAMLALVDDGPMEAVPNRGYRAVVLSDADLAEITQLRYLLEVPAAGQVADSDLRPTAAPSPTGPGHRECPLRGCVQ